MTREDPPGPGGAARSLLRLVFHLGSMLVLVAASIWVPLPVTQIVPAPPTSISSLITVRGRATTPLNGSALLTAVSVGRTSPLGLLRGMTDATIDLRLGTRLAGVTQEEFFQAEAVRFERSIDLAVAVGARAAGVPVELSSAAFVTMLLRDAPARGELEPGDLITAVAGEPVTSAEQLEERLRDVPGGGSVTVRVRRDGTSRRLELTSGRYDYQGRTHTGFGVLIQTVAADVRLPFRLDVRETSIGGSSAGLMVALTVYDLLASDDLLDGRVIAGTGELGPDGQVGGVAEIDAKVVAAERAGADVFLVPGPQAGVAQAAADEVEVIGVRSLEDAVRALSAS